jgi:hypothetical protein
VVDFIQPASELREISFIDGLEVQIILMQLLSIIPVVRQDFMLQFRPDMSLIIKLAPFTQKQDLLVSLPITLVGRRN